MPRWPAASSTTPRACPTANAVRTLAPKYSSSMASASGWCSSSSSPTRAWMSASRRSSGTPGRVSITPSSTACSREPDAAHDAVAGARGAGIDAEHKHGQTFCAAARTPPAPGRARTERSLSRARRQRNPRPVLLF